MCKHPVIIKFDFEHFTPVIYSQAVFFVNLVLIQPITLILITSVYTFIPSAPILIS